MTPFVKNGLTLLGILVVGSLGYYLFVVQGNSDLSDSVATANSAKLASDQFLRELNNIKDIDLDGTFFQDTRFQSFEDYTLPVAESDKGRTNPFFQSR